jgi:hypothetical protein
MKEFNGFGAGELPEINVIIYKSGVICAKYDNVANIITVCAVSGVRAHWHNIAGVLHNDGVFWNGIHGK